MGIGMLLVATGLPGVRSALAPLVSGDRAAQRVRLRRALRVAEPARALSRAAQSVRRRDRGLHGSCGAGRVAAGAAGRRRDGGGASAERVRSDQYANVWVANFTGVAVADITRITLPFQVAVATLAAIAAVGFGPGLFGVAGPPVFSPAEAATAPPAGMFRRNLRAARSRSRRRVRARWQPPGSFTVSCKRGRGCAPFGFRLLQPRATAPESRTPRRCW